MIPAALAPLVAHLWQSTLFAAVAALLVLALRRNPARVRYWVWLVASCKFLIPFSWLVSIGHLFQLHSAPAIVPYAFTVATEAVSAPMFLISVPSAQPPAPHASALLMVLAAVWACGFAVVVGGWMREWLRIGAIVRAALPLSLGVPIRAVSTTARVEPGVFGIWRPILLLPDGIDVRLTRAELQGILAHELCHVRRRDNLTAALHMLVEATFWFYPVVWWLGARLIDERERACDEEALRAGSEAQAYAESILKVCEFYLESPLACVSGTSGSDLKKRVSHIMKCCVSDKLSYSRKILLITAGVAAISGPVVFGFRVLAQAQEADWQKGGGR